MRAVRNAAIACAAALMTAVASARAAQIFESVGSVPEFGIDPSVRSQSMGGASGAVFWGTGPNHWANPAFLGLAEGIAYEDATSDFYLSRFVARRGLLGHGGLGVALAGRPFQGPGGLELVADPAGPGSLVTTDEIRSWGAGVSLSGIAATVAAMRHDEPPRFTRFADLCLGYSRKSLERDFGVPGLDSDALGVDWGVLVRGAAPFAPGIVGGTPARLEAGYAYSVQNANDVGASGSAGRASRPHRHGVAARFALDLPADWGGAMPAWLAPGFDPLLSLGGAWDREFISIQDGPTRWDESHLGGEMGIANVAFLRLGQRSGSRSADRDTWGYGFALPVGRLAGFRYDHTTLAEFSGFPETTSEAWSLWVNPVELARTLR